MILVRYEKTLPKARTPVKGSKDATGSDLFAAEEKVLHVGEIRAVSTGLKFDMSALPPAIDIQIRSRSGLAMNHGVAVLNSPGTIDRDYRGEIKVILANFGDFPYVVQVGERIAQMVVGLVYGGELVMFPVEKIEDNTSRGSGGFGSTGL